MYWYYAVYVHHRIPSSRTNVKLIHSNRREGWKKSQARIHFFWTSSSQVLIAMFRVYMYVLCNFVAMEKRQVPTSTVTTTISPYRTPEHTFQTISLLITHRNAFQSIRPSLTISVARRKVVQFRCSLRRFQTSPWIFEQQASSFRSSSTSFFS